MSQRDHRTTALAGPVDSRTPRKVHSRGVMWACVVLVVGVVASIAAAWEADHSARQTDAVRFERQTERVEREVKRRVRLYTYGLKSLAGLWSASASVERHEFAAMASRWDLPADFPGAVGVGYIEHVPHESLAAFVAGVRSDGAPDFDVVTSTETCPRAIVKYIEPLDANRSALGLDVYQREKRSDALLRAAASGEPTLTEPVVLVQAPYEGLGLVYYMPIYKPGLPIATPEERSAAVEGWVFMPIVAGRALSNVVEAARGEVDVAVYAGHDAASQTMIFDSQRRVDREAAPSSAAEPPLRDQSSLAVGGESWTLRFSSSPSFSRASRAAVWALGGGGSVLSLALAGLVLSLATTAARARSLADSMTANLRESESRFRNMADAAPVMIWMTDSTGSTTHLSKQWAEFTGLPLESLCGYAWLERVHPNESADVGAAFANCLAQRQPFEAEYRIRDAAGRYRWLVDRGLPRFAPDGEFLGYVGGCMDITDRREAEQALARERARLAAFVEHAPAAVAMFDRDMRYIALSHRWVAEYRLEGQPVVGRSHYDVFPNISDQWRAIHHRCLQGAVERCEKDAWRPDGWTHDQYLRWEVRPWREADGSIGGVMMYTRDITAEVLVLNDLADARQRAEAASRAKSGFLANMSHEIRTPMTAIMGFADLLVDGSEQSLSPTERASALRTIKRNGQHLLAIINDILDVSKIEAGKMSIESITTDPAALLADVVALMQVRAAGKGLRLEQVFETPIPRTIVSDPVRLKQILVNLLGNAIKFTEVGSVTVRAAYDAVGPGGGRLRFTIADTGIGMTEAQATQLFNPFTQADETMTRKFGGTGLGLTICARLAEMLGGAITVKSEPDKGSEFTVTVAAHQPSAALVSQPVADSHATSSVNAQSGRPVTARALSGLRILLVEDGPDNQRLIKFHLERAGAHVTTVERGDDAVLAASDPPGTARSPDDTRTLFDLILMDMQMPGMDGYTASTTLRARGCRTPILALTAHAMQGDRERCLEAGCDEYCTKPIEKDALLDMCARMARGASEVGRASRAA